MDLAMHRSLYPFFCLCPLQKEPHRCRLHGLECLREVESLHQTTVLINGPTLLNAGRKSGHLCVEEGGQKEDKNTRHNSVLVFGPLKDQCQRASAIKAKYHVPPSS
ncbi:hypothetical protein NC652_017224 [Populus alba x Populus x berolinensis]|uniref:Uncharacterized protein n=1 Tax=Populus alba x Populus x berolinensis TaxID=444605 RepID=A0AAD6QPK2_9ROSI|nr:hypothetical protein NC652_017224 [Populus alba x Populus x berolinensis]KAJ6994241.1 hypothetical protein NC653_017157 [Populus alba x Populus x berolinensis]